MLQKVDMSNNVQTAQGWLSSKTEQHIDSTEDAMTALLQIYRYLHTGVYLHSDWSWMVLR